MMEVHSLETMDAPKGNTSLFKALMESFTPEQSSDIVIKQKNKLEKSLNAPNSPDLEKTITETSQRLESLPPAEIENIYKTIIPELLGEDKLFNELKVLGLDGYLNSGNGETLEKQFNIQHLDIRILTGLTNLQSDGFFNRTTREIGFKKDAVKKRDIISSLLTRKRMPREIEILGHEIKHAHQSGNDVVSSGLRTTLKRWAEPRLGVIPTIKKWWGDISDPETIEAQAWRTNRPIDIVSSEDLTTEMHELYSEYPGYSIIKEKLLAGINYVDTFKALGYDETQIAKMIQTEGAFVNGNRNLEDAKNHLGRWRKREDGSFFHEGYEARIATRLKELKLQPEKLGTLKEIQILQLKKQRLEAQQRVIEEINKATTQQGQQLS